MASVCLLILLLLHKESAEEPRMWNQLLHLLFLSVLATAPLSAQLSDVVFSDLIRNYLLSSNGCARKTESFIFRGAYCLHCSIRFFLCLRIAVYLTREEVCFVLVVQVVSWRDTLQFTVWSFWYNKPLCNDFVILFCIHKLGWFMLSPVLC